MNKNFAYHVVICSASIAVITFLMSLSAIGQVQQKVNMEQLKYTVGILGAPDYPQVEWNDLNLQRMKDCGFNTMQLNIAWGSRPDDEPLNLEDVVTVPARFALAIDKSLSNTLHTPERIEARSEKLKQRIELCKKYDIHTIFQFGAPFQGHPRHETEPLPQCVSDTLTIERYITLIKEFGEKFPGVDDLMLYTYDQDAWLCSEYGPCPRCHGVPVALRVSKFVNILAHRWKKINPKGMLWWEPWELSAGEVYETIALLDSSCVGMAIHSNIAEVQIAFPADRWFKNVLCLAKKRDIPVIAEVWTGCPTEEMEPYTHIPTPLLTLQALKAVSTAGTLDGIKEYYGNVPDVEDPNLRMTGIFFHNPDIQDSTALVELTKPYMKAAQGVAKYWELSSEAVEFYPWGVSWYAREVGRSDPSHLMTAATLKGASWNTPAWQSSRRTHFMRTDETNEPNFWMREDIQLRCQKCATLMQQAIATAQSVQDSVPEKFRQEFNESIDELSGFRTRVLAYVYHLRETNLADLIRSSINMKLPVAMRMKNVAELREILLKDQENQGRKEPIASAIKLLDEDLNKFLNTYFLPSAPSNQRGVWSITSN